MAHFGEMVASNVILAAFCGIMLPVIDAFAWELPSGSTRSIASVRGRAPANAAAHSALTAHRKVVNEQDRRYLVVHSVHPIDFGGKIRPCLLKMS